MYTEVKTLYQIIFLCRTKKSVPKMGMIEGLRTQLKEFGWEREEKEKTESREGIRRKKGGHLCVVI